jgi:hypothetical protein
MFSESLASLESLLLGTAWHDRTGQEALDRRTGSAKLRCGKGIKGELSGASVSLGLCGARRDIVRWTTRRQ